MSHTGSKDVFPEEKALENTGPSPMELIQKAKAGDSAAYGAIYELYLSPVYRYVFIRVREKTLAEDITQTVFLKVYEALARFEDTGKTPLAYFLTVARNTLIDHFRKRREITPASDEFDFDLIEGNDPTPLEESELREARELLYEALDKISEGERQVLTLKYLNSLSNKEIAELTGKTEENIRQLQSRGLKALRKHMQE
jgi:RNA polymerase sigma-70 factor (ECF subfamily)